MTTGPAPFPLVSGHFRPKNGYDWSTRKDGPRLVTEGLANDWLGVAMAVLKGIHQARSVR